MSLAVEHLMAISIGPVQGFIAAARRTRDFWIGSTILSEVAKAVAKQVVDSFGERGARLIFPGTDPVKEELGPLTFVDENRDRERDFNVSNVVLFFLPAGIAPAEVRQVCRERAFGRFFEIADHAFEAAQRDLRREAWNKQREDRDLLEFFAAWYPHEETKYEECRGSLMRLLNGRKALRDFSPWRVGGRQPKSSLDGSRETVLEDLSRYEQEQLERRGRSRRSGLRAKPREQLDLIGVMKRAEYGHDSVSYPSVSRVAADPWIAGVRATPGDSKPHRELLEVMEWCRKLANRFQALRERTQPAKQKFPWLADFPFEGVALFPSRYLELKTQCPFSGTLDGRKVDLDEFHDELDKALDQLRKLVTRLTRTAGLGEPSPYLAILAADGDRMGETLSHLSKSLRPPGISLHKEFSRNQSTFAKRVREIVNGSAEENRGLFVHGAVAYAGADDILAFVPVHQCLQAARLIHDEFDDRIVAEPLLKEVLSGLNRKPTLSVGIAIGHFMEPLEDLLGYARDAEKRAKSPSQKEVDRGQSSRNGLALAIHPRGGVPFTVRDNWSGPGQPLDQRLLEWAELHQEKMLPTKAAYDLRLASRFYGNWKDKTDDERQTLRRAVQLDALRILSRKRGSGGREGDKRMVRDLIRNVQNAADLENLAHELIAGQWIGDALRQAAGPQPSSDPGDELSQEHATGSVG